MKSRTFVPTAQTIVSQEMLPIFFKFTGKLMNGKRGVLPHVCAPVLAGSGHTVDLWVTKQLAWSPHGQLWCLCESWYHMNSSENPVWCSLLTSNGKSSCTKALTHQLQSHCSSGKSIGWHGSRSHRASGISVSDIECESVLCGAVRRMGECIYSDPCYQDAAQQQSVQEGAFSVLSP